ncbi:MAG: AAA family ATPase [Gemmatimonadaceae bacterium]|jgi:predicted ATPase|nr:AAA family ATPase [Gemmatimonadaceae bacterium]
MLRTLAIAGYRSLRDVRIALGPVTLVTGANGTGKSSLYRALRLLTDIAHGRLIASLAQEGGLGSTLWAGPEIIGAAVKRGDHAVQGTLRQKPVALKLGFASDEYSYAIDVGLPVPNPMPTRFGRDPEMKREALWVGEVASRHSMVAERRGPVVQIRDRSGSWAVTEDGLPPWESMMTYAADPREARELLLLREQMRRWRFYDHFDSGRTAPARHPYVGTRTPVLAGDGRDLAAAVQTIRETGREEEFDNAIADAFPGSRVEVETNNGYFSLVMQQHGLLRTMSMSELSDGTLRYLLLVAALLSPRPPQVMVLNEPETSLHPDLVPPLARLIARAARDSQLIIVSHAGALVSAIEGATASERVTLVKEFGETRVEQEGAVGRWSWPAR